MSNVSIFKKASDKARYDPDWFCSEILRTPNDPWQSEMMEAVADLDRLRIGLPTKFNHKGKTRLTICAFHGPGKTHFMAKLAHWWNFTRIGKIPCTAPKEKQLITRLWPEFNDLKNKAVREYQDIMLVNKKSVTWADDMNWQMIAEAASTPENLAGYHHKNLLFLVEEASGVDDRMFEVIEGALTTEGAVLILIGNPTRTEGEFYRSHTHKDSSNIYYRKKIHHSESTRISQKWVKGMIRKYGEESPVVQVRVFGNFVEASENQLIVLQWIEEARKDWKPDGSKRRLIIACDVADGGEDETVITVAYEYDSFTVFKSIHRFSFPPAKSPILAAEAIMRIAEAENYDILNDTLVVDGIGVGAGTAGVLLKANKYNVIVFKGGSTENVDTKQWRNQRVRSFIVMRDMFRDGKIVIDEDFCHGQDWDDFTAQMCSVKTKPALERIEDLLGKQEMKGKGTKSPDMADSPSMIFANQTPYLVSGIPEAVFFGESISNNYDAGLS